MTKKCLLLGLAIAGFVFSATAALAETRDFIKTGSITTTPVGHAKFCRAYPDDCNVKSNKPRVMRLTRKRWQELIKVNDQVNDEIVPLTDLELYNVAEHWTYPPGRGDCEDYVILKRRLLIQNGWPPEALLITVVKDKYDDGHAVLTVRTDFGEFILDNQIDPVLPWEQSPYKFLKRQSAHNLAKWQSVHDHRSKAFAFNTQ